MTTIMPHIDRQASDETKKSDNLPTWIENNFQEAGVAWNLKDTKFRSTISLTPQPTSALPDMKPEKIYKQEKSNSVQNIATVDRYLEKLEKDKIDAENRLKKIEQDLFDRYRNYENQAKYREEKLIKQIDDLRLQLSKQYSNQNSPRATICPETAVAAAVKNFKQTKTNPKARGRKRKKEIQGKVL
uniref:Uncharacterized protein n=1 Tax=Romanomermis culicivorax TaxID=13658 RepID=A0A915HJ28_ROMCU